MACGVDTISVRMIVSIKLKSQRYLNGAKGKDVLYYISDCDSEPCGLPSISNSLKPKTIGRVKTIMLWGRVLLLSSVICALIIALLIFITLSVPPSRDRVAISVTHSARNEEVKTYENKNHRQYQSSRSFASPINVVAAPLIRSVAFNSTNIDLPDVALLPASLIKFGSANNFKAPSKKGGGEGREIGIGAMGIDAKRLGIILDISSSMNDELPLVRHEIYQKFPDAIIIEVRGCALDYSAGDDVLNKRFGTRKFVSISTLNAIELLIDASRIDAVYWFSDLQDLQTNTGKNRLRGLLGLIPNSQRRLVKLYVQSVGRNPSRKLCAIAKDSGGKANLNSNLFTVSSDQQNK